MKLSASGVFMPDLTLYFLKISTYVYENDPYKEIGEARGLFALVNTRPKSVGRIKVL